MKSGRWLASLLALVFTTAHADNYIGYESKVKGMALWWIDPPNASFLAKLGKNPEFISYCDGTRRLYVYELQRSYACRISASPVARRELLKKSEAARRDPSSENAEEQYSVELPGLTVERERKLTISMSPLVKGEWHFTAAEADETLIANRVAKQFVAQAPRFHVDGYRYVNVIGFSDARLTKLAEREGKERYAGKITAGEVEILLVPTLYESNPLGGNLISTVLVRKGKDRDYSFAGHIKGCPSDLGADLDGDGVPELLTETCSNSEGAELLYVKLYPKVDILARFDHN